MVRKPQPDNPHQTCEVCSQIKDQEWASQKYGWEENNTYLPEITARLILVRDFKPSSSRKLQLWQCPLCETCYLYESDYEYLVNGSEDDESLTRLTAAEAIEYWQRPIQE